MCTDSITPTLHLHPHLSPSVRSHLAPTTLPPPYPQVQEVDSREAQKAGLLRPLVRKEIESHFADFGLEPEFTTHNTMRGLSGGQKVKVVLAAATWRRPHIVILDEPTNYLDRESLAALISALKEYEGGVLVITHVRSTAFPRVSSFLSPPFAR